MKSRDDHECPINYVGKTKAKIVTENFELKVKPKIPPLFQTPEMGASWTVSLKTGAKREIWTVKTSPAEGPRDLILDKRLINMDKSQQIQHTLFILIFQIFVYHWTVIIGTTKGWRWIIVKTNTVKHLKVLQISIPVILIGNIHFWVWLLHLINCSEESMNSRMVVFRLDIEPQSPFPANTCAIWIIILILLWNSIYPVRKFGIYGNILPFIHQ